MFTQYYDNHGCDSGLLWICNRCLFPNFYTSLLLNDSFSATVSNSFGSLFSLSSPGPPLRSSSPTIPALPRKKPVERKLKVVSLNCNGLKGLTKRAEFHSYIELHQPDIILGCESKLTLIFQRIQSSQKAMISSVRTGHLLMRSRVKSLY